MDDCIAESGRLSIVRCVAEYVISSEEGGVFVILNAEVDYLAKGVVRIGPGGVAGRRIILHRSLSRDIAPDCHIEIMSIGRIVKSRRDVEGDELKDLWAGIDNAAVQAILKIDEGCIGRARKDQPCRQ